MRLVTRKPPFRSTLGATLLCPILLAGCVLGGVTGDNPPGSDEFCLTLIEETIQLGEQLVDLEDNPEDIDVDTACQYLANFIRMVDEGCIDEVDFEGSALPEGTTRDTLVDLRAAFDCPTQ